MARIKGQPYFIEDFEIDLNAHGTTNSATITLPINGNPDFSAAFKDVGGTAVTGEIFLGWPPDPTPSPTPSIVGLQRAYYGLVAQYDPKCHEDQVTFELRSLASPLVDQKIQQLAQNVSTVAFIESMCSKFGLKFQPQLGNAALTVQQVLGDIYLDSYNFSSAIHGMRIWDLILQCAQFDNVDVWEDQGTLYHVAPDLIQRQTVDIAYGRDLEELTASHALMFSKDVQVEVRSAQPRVSQSSAVRTVANDDGSFTQTSVNKVTTGSPQWGTPNIVSTTYFPNGTTTTTRRVSGGAFSTGLTSQGSEPTKQRYIFYPRNQDPASMNAFAITQWMNISKHECTVQMRLPFTQTKGIIPLTALLRLHNVPYTAFNNTYYPTKIMLSGGINRAFGYEIDALSHILAQGAV